MDNYEIERKFDRRLMARVRAGDFGSLKSETRLGGQWNYLFSYNGEKNLGELGPLREYGLDYYTLRARSWQLYLECDIAQIVLNKWTKWTIGGGLKVQSEPQKLVLENEGIRFDAQEFSKQVEAYFELFADSEFSDHARMTNFDMLQYEIFKHSKVGGDAVVILRYEDDSVSVQVIDGVHVVSPMYGTERYPQELANGNRIEYGIELNQRNQHIAYYVRKAGLGYSFETERIQARTKEGLVTAFMVYGSKYRIDNHRGMPILAVMYEKAKKLERYSEAALKAAEERAKITYWITHTGIEATGENPMIRNAVEMRDLEGNTGKIPVTTEGEILAKKAIATTNSQFFNMPLGGDIKAMDSKSESGFADFFGAHIDLFCAAAEIPPNVAMSKYDSNFSASRAALKDWEHSLKIERKRFGTQAIKPVYTFWMHIMILLKKITAPGYINAFDSGLLYVMAAYRRMRVLGDPVPHIDPVKEVDAVRKKLGVAADAMPLTTLEEATESLGAGGDAASNVEQFAEELKDSITRGIKIPEPKPAAPRPAGA